VLFVLYGLYRVGSGEEKMKVDIWEVVGLIVYFILAAGLITLATRV